MTINMNDSRIISISQLKKFLQASIDFDFNGISQKEKYKWVETTLTKFRYFSLRKKDKNIIKNYIHEMTGYSDAQLTRLISKKKKFGKILPSSKKR
ncbi:MAG: hypothetical protein GF347_00700 [Candidatus Moranbacteria bacterium]|nr:hypothetical protein [Candidatus Moranbacteria bacterium]